MNLVLLDQFNAYFQNTEPQTNEQYCKLTTNRVETSAMSPLPFHSSQLCHVTPCNQSESFNTCTICSPFIFAAHVRVICIEKGLFTSVM